jgi:hypothetical protein
MTEPQDNGRQRASPRLPNLPGEGVAGWNEGIRALYDAVVQEPLPADFHKLLEELGKKMPN